VAALDPCPLLEEVQEVFRLTPQELVIWGHLQVPPTVKTGMLLLSGALLSLGWSLL